MMGNPWRTVMLALLLAGVIVSSEAAGDTEAELVLRGGQRLETRDGWEIRGRRVLFRDAAGRMRSLPLADVDLEATRRAKDQDEGEAKATAPQSTEPDPVLVLDMKNTPTQTEAERHRSRAAAAERKRDVDRQKYSVVRGVQRRHMTPRGGDAGRLASVRHWTVAQSRQTGGLRLVGTLDNSSDRFLDQVEIHVRLLDKDGKLIGGGRGYVDQSRLRPGSSSHFHWIDPHRESLDGLTVDFRIRARALSWGSRPRHTESTIPEVPFFGKKAADR